MSTLTEVAKRAGVSPSLVSRVLNDKLAMPIPQATILRVREAAAELGYRPNALARALATGRTHTLGLHYGNMTDPHFARMLEAVEAKAAAKGYHLLVSSDMKSLLGSGRVDGALIVGLPEELEQPPRAARNRPIVYVSPGQAIIPNGVIWNDVEGAACAVEHLIALGHRRIAGLFGDYSEEGPPQAKVLGFRRAVQNANLQSVELYGRYSSDQIENGCHLTRELLRSQPGCTALFARNDYLAVGALEALQESARRVPSDFSVVGYNDTILARCATPRLTSLHTPFAEAGVRALENLVQLIESGEAAFPGTALPVTLTERDSCAPPTTTTS
jgi:DNA-binding LacI/PurR family transcriptional regulator